jgi:hypothetical protein
MRPKLRLVTFVCLSLLCAVWYWPRGHRACAASTESQGCRLVMEALESASKLSVGMRRAEIEKDFELDGGMTFQNRGTYTYRRCHYIKVDVEFQKSDPTSNTIETFSPGDQASKISKPYLAYPVSD